MVISDRGLTISKRDYGVFLSFLSLGSGSIGTDHYARDCKGGGSVVVDFLFIVTPIVGVCNWTMFC